MAQRVGKGDLARKVIERLEEKYTLSPAAASVIIDAVFGAIVDLLKEKGRVNVPKFGTFVVVESKERTARNPRTGETVTIPAKKRPKLRVSSKLLEAVNE